MLTIAAFLAFGLAQSATPPPKPAPDAILATVDGAPITAADVEAYLWAWKEKEVVRELADHKMIAAEAARQGVSVSDAEVKAKIDEQLAQVKANLPQGQTLDDFLKSRGAEPSRLFLAARSAVLVDKLAAKEFQPAKYVKVSTLVFRTTGDTTEALTKAIKAADAAYASLQAGKPWKDVLRVYETNSTVLSNDGLVGWKAYDAFPDSVRTQMDKLKPMGYTKPTQTANGIQIFRLDARGESANPADLAELRSQYIQSARQSLVPRLRQATKIEILDPVAKG